jgi:hypothetical protein
MRIVGCVILFLCLYASAGLLIFLMCLTETLWRTLRSTCQNSTPFPYLVITCRRPEVHFFLHFVRWSMLSCHTV